MEDYALLAIGLILSLIVFKIGKKVGYIRAKRNRRNWILNILIRREEERLRTEKEKEYQESQENIGNNSESEP